MQIKLQTLMLESFLCNDIEHFVFREELSHDSKIKDYLKNIKGRLQELPDSDKKELQDKASYIVKDEDKLIGYVHLEEITQGHSLELHYAVHRNFRGQGYGSKILTEVSNYILNNMNEVKKIQLSIDKSNIESKRCAISSGYQYQMKKDVYYLKNK